MKLLDSNVLHWVLQILNKAFPMVERPNYNTTQVIFACVLDSIE